MAADYRSDKMDSIEGLGRARRRWMEFVGTQPRVVGPTIEHMPQLVLMPGGKGDTTRPDARPVDAKERSELMGFWLMWHLAGGFRRLEEWGWHRATIHRKIRRFRDAYGGIHPDEASFDWVTLDLHELWGLTADIYLDLLREQDEAEEFARED